MHDQADRETLAVQSKSCRALPIQADHSGQATGRMIEVLSISLYYVI